jgi:pimeloyl-ACP methyl ester carboxylesterase
MPTVTSKDGTRIAFWQSGKGPPLVLVHGTSASHSRWAPVLSAFEQHFSIYAIDRRGRGESGDQETYSIEREFEDVAAIIDALAEPAYLLGHSYGGICALEAALLTTNIQKLVLYEPPIPVTNESIYPEGVVDKLEALLSAGDREGVVSTFMQEVVRMPPHEFEYYRTLPAWPARVAAANTLPRELRAHEGYHFAAERFRGLHTPTLLLLGGDSPDFFKAAIKTLDAVLPNSHVVTIPKQQHIAIDTAPERFAGEVMAFLNS